MENISLSYSLTISAFSMIVVFFVLFIISYLIDVTAFVTKKFKNKKEV